MKSLLKKQENKTLSSRMLVWGITVVFSILYIFIGNSIVTMDLDIFNVDNAYAEKAIVREIGDLQTSSYEMVEGVSSLENNTQYFTAEIVKGAHKGETVLAAQTSDNYTITVPEDPVSVGDKVILYNYGTKEGNADWIFGGYARLDGIIILAVIFALLVVIFGKLKGINTLISLVFTCLAVFSVFIPAVLNGYNLYFLTFVTCIYTIVMTLLITNGATAKSLTTILGCTFGVFVAAVLSKIFDSVLRLTGMTDEHSIYLMYLENGKELDLRALIFSMIVIGAMGAVMDVSMDISSSLYEIHTQADNLSFYKLFMSGIRIGRDVMGTMANTLVLAYIGSNLCATLLYITYSASLYELLNKENIIVEMLNALVGSTAILLTIPLTSLVCAFLYTRKHKEKLSVPVKKISIDTSKFNEWKSDVQNLKISDSVSDNTDLKERRTMIIPDDPVLIYYDKNTDTTEKK